MSAPPAPRPSIADIAGTGDRVGAAIIDILVAFAIMAIIGALLGDSEVGQLPNNQRSVGVKVNLTGDNFYFFLLAVLAYHWISEAVTGRTIGKKVVGLKVVRRDGSAYTWMKAFIRNGIRIIDVLPAFYLLGFLVVMSTDRKQRIGDLVAGTVIVRG